MIILAIETSCDDTSLSLLNNDKVLSLCTITNHELYSIYDGIIPEIASRSHGINIFKCFDEVMNQSKISYEDIDVISYTNEPGLPGSLHVGKIFAYTIGYLLDKKVIPINHIYGHIFSPYINNFDEIKYPFLSLIASGKTTSIFLINRPTDIKLLNKTLDDAIGESLDKIGKYANLEYPGGKTIDKIFDINLVKKNLVKFPNPEQDFSFSGYKTKFKQLLEKAKDKNTVISLVSTYQWWAINLLVDKIKYYSKLYNVNLVCVGGGVSANSYWRDLMSKLNIEIKIPEKKYACDNAAMIGFYAFLIQKQNNN